MSIWQKLQNNPSRIQQILMGLGMMATDDPGRYQSYLQGGMSAMERAAEMERERAARQKFQGLLGTKGEVTRGPDSDLGPAGVKPSGYLGGELSGQEFAAQALGIPGYEQIGAGLLGKYLDQDADAAAAAAAAGENEFEQELKQRKLLKDYQNQVKPYENTLLEMRSNYEAMIQSAQAEPTAAGGRGAADLAMVFNFAKMLDPTSVVREGEQQMIQRSDGVFGYLRGLSNSLQQGKGSLDVGTRQGLVAEAQRQFQSKSQAPLQAIQHLQRGFGKYSDLAINPAISGFGEYLQNLEMPTYFGAEPAGHTPGLGPSYQQTPEAGAGPVWVPVAPFNANDGL